MIKCDMGNIEIKGNQMIVQSEVSLAIMKLLENADSEFGKELIFESCLGSFFT